MGGCSGRRKKNDNVSQIELTCATSSETTSASKAIPALANLANKMKIKRYLVLTASGGRFFFLTEARALAFEQRNDGANYLGLVEVPSDSLPEFLQKGAA